MKERILEALYTAQLTVLCVVLFVCYLNAETAKEQTEDIIMEIESIKAESADMQKSIDKLTAELKHNNIVVLKVLEGEW